MEITAEQTSKINILKKLHSIMSDVNGIAKDKRNSFLGYEYASDYAIKKIMHDILVKHRVLFLPMINEKKDTVYTTDKGKRNVITDIQMDYRFYDVDSGEYIGGYFLGSGADGEDKGLYKAVTGAIKYILTSTFLIPTGDDPDKDQEKKPAASAKEQEDGRPWLSEKSFIAMKEEIGKGNGAVVKERLGKYKMKREYADELAKLLTSANGKKATA